MFFVFVIITSILWLTYFFLSRCSKKIECRMIKNMSIEETQMSREVTEISQIYGMKLAYGKYYAYNPRKKEIILVKKEEYSNYDRFAFFHEFGHFLDDESNNKILHFRIIIAINRLIIFPIYTFLTINRLINNSNNLMIVFTIFFAITLMIALFHLIFILIYEVSASKKALKIMTKEQKKETPFIKELYVLAKIFVAMQVVFESIIIIYMVGMFICTFYI